MASAARLRRALTWIPRHPFLALRRLLIGLLLVQLWLWIYDRDPPRTNVEGTARKTVFTAGETFEASWRMTITRLCPGNVARWLTTEADPNWVLIIANQALSSDQGMDANSPLPARRTVEVAPFVIPSHAPLDNDPEIPQAAYHVQVAFHCNPLHRLFPIYVNYPVIRFKIAKPDVLGRDDDGRSSSMPPFGTLKRPDLGPPAQHPEDG